MNLSRINALIIRHLYLYKRSMPRFMDIFFWPVFDLLILGFLSLYLNTFTLPGVNIISILVGGVILWQLVDRTQNAISVYFLEDVWERNFLNIFVTPLKISEFFVAGILLSFIRLFFVGAVMSIVALLLYKFNILSFGILLVPYILNLFLFAIVIALFINSIILRFGSSAQILAFGISILIQPLSAVYYPVSSLPGFLQPLAYAVPTTYVFESLRSISSGGQFDLNNFLISLGLNIVYIALMWWFFIAMFKKVKKLGRLLKIQN